MAGRSCVDQCERASNDVAGLCGEAVIDKARGLGEEATCRVRLSKRVIPPVERKRPAKRASPALTRSLANDAVVLVLGRDERAARDRHDARASANERPRRVECGPLITPFAGGADRKSTRLNSSH